MMEGFTDGALKVPLRDLYTIWLAGWVVVLLYSLTRPARLSAVVDS